MIDVTMLILVTTEVSFTGQDQTHCYESVNSYGARNDVVFLLSWLISLRNKQSFAQK